MKQEIRVFDYAKEITAALPKGALLTTKNGEKVNSMTIGWGMLGIFVVIGVIMVITIALNKITENNEE